MSAMGATGFSGAIAAALCLSGLISANPGFRVAGPDLLYAQGRGQATPSQTAKAIAPTDLTGYWTAVVTEDWHVRMLTPSKGDFGSGVAGTIENPGVGMIGAGPNPAAQGDIPYNVAGAQA